MTNPPRGRTRYEVQDIVMEFELLPTPISGKADWRQFRCLKLANGCTVCLGPFKTRAGFLASLAPSMEPPGIIKRDRRILCLTSICLLLFCSQ
jgi:hypothetical protein